MSGSSTRGDDADRLDHLRLVTKVARLYHTTGLRQQEIAERLGLSQSRVSRLLQAAEEAGIVRTVVFPPGGIFAELEDELERVYGLLDAHVVDVPAESDDGLQRGLGGAAAAYLHQMQPAARTVGFTSWSRTLRSLVGALPRARGSVTDHVVEMIGDIGAPATQHEAALATQRFAGLVGAEPVFIRAPGVVASVALREALLAQDSYLRDALAMLDHLDLAITGAGPLDVAEVLRGGSNFFSPEQIETVRRMGAVGQVNLRFLDAMGNEIASPLDELVIGVSLRQLKAAERRLLVAGGDEKHEIIRALLRGRWVNMVVIDLATAEWLLGAQQEAGPGPAQALAAAT